ncbi:A/G-specific adenine glycosylase [Thioalkalivibrio nitratireducens DSM 14787]|uniref:Adenine DNA glycosylase n=1 Tax=Thioalkalivibrio nitratireducens (strain DSM 14787 / UNIQEM 213 / ALEN2) TaxID=1255043 RepID=L0E051_THIND|nr:A/G-specific adenine glycosylase [Thioalkalivibrio nitratireducens]AGA35219.1 A/G-specific adenine glycosylase [Thioalkalivibrio nitratireducens DSM 14787]
MSSGFASRLLAWFERHGRHGLPWQHPRTAYRVWVSEIMLQQTRVETVVPYFTAFVDRFPDPETLADAPLDEVLHLWSGLGYYARARNLHRAARVVVERYRGELPQEPAALEALPGIGRSTAAAILAQAHDRPMAILDGNVRRVLARHRAVDGWPGQSRVQATLWGIAESLVPGSRAADYTQAMMDLGALICTRSRPACSRCPVAGDCQARLQDRVAELPAARPGRAVPTRTRWAALVRSPAGILLERRAPSGIWGGLYSLPEADEREQLVDRMTACWAGVCEQDGPPARIAHTFSHYRLDLWIVSFRLPSVPCGIMEGQAAIWYKPAFSHAVGLPAPIARFLRDQGTPHDGTNG